MALNQTPAGERVHIGFFGRRNAGKSSLMNAVTGQELAVVSEVKGTTTDPVSKTMELLPLGPVMVIDTPGIDDEGELGDLRVRKSRQVLNKTDIAVLVVDGTVGETKEDMELLALFHEKQVPYLVVYHKADLLPEAGAGKSSERNKEKSETSHPVLYVSSKTGLGIEDLKNRLAVMKPFKEEKDLLEGLVRPGDLVVLVTPIDKAAPKGRLILPQQQTIRALLDHGCVSMVVRETELEQMLKKIGQKPALVITDSQAFSMVSSIVPKDIPLTSFSILFARYKGDLRQAKALEKIQDGDKILISEGCTHHRQCNDIGTVKLPGWIRSYTGREPEFVYTSGTGFQEDLKAFRVIVHCGACMLNEREMKYRLACARDQGVDITNYGIVIAHIHGILKRSLGPFPDIEALLED